MHLCFYDESFISKLSNHSVVASITASGEPKRRIWQTNLAWSFKSSIETESGSIQLTCKSLGIMLERLSEFEEELVERGVLRNTPHMMIFAPTTLKISVLRRWNWSTTTENIVGQNLATHLPTQLYPHFQVPV